MAFCKQCGAPLEEGTKFCGACGAPAQAAQKTKAEQNRTTFEGAVHKCPNCGAALSSFMQNCPECGCEIRSADALKDFEKKLYPSLIKFFVNSISTSKGGTHVNYCTDKMVKVRK